MMDESDSPFVECANTEVLEWLLRSKRDDQRLMTTIIGHPGLDCDPDSGREWHAKRLTPSTEPTPLRRNKP